MQNTVKVEADFSGHKKTWDGDSAFLIVGQHTENGTILINGGMCGHVCEPVVTGILEGLVTNVGGWTVLRCLVRVGLQRLFGGGGPQ